MHIAVDTNCILPGQVGGIENYTLGLLHRLTAPGSPADRLLLLTRPENHSLFAGFAHSNHVRVICQPRTSSSWDDPGSAHGLRQFQDQKRRLLHEAGVDVVHFPGNTVNPLDIALPVVLNLHDLQHRHFPQYFSADELARREKWWLASARRANVLLAASRFVADDLQSQFGIDARRIIVTPDPLQDDFRIEPTAKELATVSAHYQLAEQFFVYPAAIWPHKNHGRLLEALASINDPRVRLVLTGGGQDCPALHEKIASLNLGARVRLLGRVDTLTLRCLYRLATALVMPSEHESISIPVFEAMVSNCPVACSNVTALPDQAGDAALLFSPDDVPAMASAMRRLLSDPELRKQLARRGRARMAQCDPAAATAALNEAYSTAIHSYAAAKAA